MSRIKLPVKIVRAGLNAYLADNRDRILELQDIADALNATPPRAFEKLTPEEFGKIMREAGRDVVIAHGRRPLNPQEAALWDMRANEFLLSRLQAFASPAPAELVKKLTTSDFILAHADAIAAARVAEFKAAGAGHAIYGEHMRVSIVRLLSEGGAA